MKNKIILYVLLGLIFFGGCDMMCNKLGLFCPTGPPSQKPELEIQKDITKVEETIEDSSATIKKASGDIKEEADNINEETTEVQSKIPNEAKEIIIPHLDSIKGSSGIIIENTAKIDTATTELASANKVLKGAGVKISTTEKALDDIVKERDRALAAKIKAEEERDSALHKAIRWLILACIVGAGACGVFGFMYGSKACLTASIVCIVIMSVAIFVETYFVYLVIGGGVILLGLLGMLAYNIIIQKKAFKEVVETVEITKDSLPEEEKEKLFGKKHNTGIMDSLQSKETMALVKEEKSKISNLWNYSKNKE
jgi:hypothetical protein